MDRLPLRNLLDGAHPVPFHGVAAGGTTVNAPPESHMLQFSVPLIVMWRTMSVEEYLNSFDKRPISTSSNTASFVEYTYLSESFSPFDLR